MAKIVKKPITYEEEFVRRMHENLIQKVKTLRAIDDDDYLYRQAASNASFQPNYMYNHRNMQQVCASLYDVNPVANWYIEFITDMILGEDVIYASENERVFDVIDSFWNHSINKMDIFSHQIVRELYIFGEICLPAFVTPQSGTVFIGYINPIDIKEVISDPQNTRIPIQVVCSGKLGYKDRLLNTILSEDEEIYISERAKNIRKKTEEQCFFFACNNFIAEQRGKSELYVIADHLDKNEQFMFNLMERIPSQLSFFWDVEINGMNDIGLKEWAKRNPTPRNATQRVHNEKVKYKAITPDIKSSDMDTISRVFRNHILGAKSIPAFYYGDGADANKATSENMSLPSIKSIKRKQRYVSYIFQSIFDFVIINAVKAGILSASEDLNYSINMVEVNPKNNKENADILAIVTKALYDAQLSGWIQKPEASAIFANFVKSTGYDGDITPTEDVKSVF